MRIFFYYLIVMIISENIKIKKKPPITLALIEEEFAKHSISPLRWAIIEVFENEITVSVSYEKND